MLEPNSQVGATRAATEAQESDSPEQERTKRLRKLRRDFQSGIVVALAFIALGLLVEPTGIGQWIQRLTYHQLHSNFPAKCEDVVVADITRIPMRSRRPELDAVTHRETMIEVLKAILKQGPKAVAIDMDLSPDGDRRIDEKDVELLEVCRSNRISVGVERSRDMSPAEWLGSEEYSELAVNVKADRADNRLMPSSYRRTTNDEALPSLGWRLAGRFKEQDIELPRNLLFTSVIYESHKGMRDEFLVDFSPIEQLVHDSVSVSTASEVYEMARPQGSPFHDRAVIVGKGDLDNMLENSFVPPGSEVAYPGVYSHACAANTLIQGPLLQPTPLGRVLLDALAVVVMFGIVFGVRYLYIRSPSELRSQRSYAVACVGAAVVVILAAFNLARSARFVWDGYPFVVSALLLHPFGERVVHGISKAWHQFLFGVEPPSQSSEKVGSGRPALLLLSVIVLLTAWHSLVGNEPPRSRSAHEVAATAGTLVRLDDLPERSFAPGGMDRSRMVDDASRLATTLRVPRVVPSSRRSEWDATIRAYENALENRGLDERDQVTARALADEDADLQTARLNLAGTLKDLGDLQAAFTLEERVLAVRSRTLPDDHADLQGARLILANTMNRLRDPMGARALQEKALEAYLKTGHDDDPTLQAARLSLAVTMKRLGDFQRARALEERVLEVFSKSLPDDSPELQTARLNLAVTLKDLGDLQAARALEERVLEIRARTLPDDHADLQEARLSLARTIALLGNHADARTLQEKALAVYSKTLAYDHPALQVARLDLAVTMMRLGEIQKAHALKEQVVEIWSRTLPEDHPALQIARANLASTLRQLGDLQGARELQEQVLEVFSRAMPNDHPDLQEARLSLATTLHSLGDLASARSLLESTVASSERTLGNDHSMTLRARLELARVLKDMADLDGACILGEEALARSEGVLGPDNRTTLTARQDLADTLFRLGRLDSAMGLQQKVVETLREQLSPDHPDVSAAEARLRTIIEASKQNPGAKK